MPLSANDDGRGERGRGAGFGRKAMYIPVSV